MNGKNELSDKNILASIESKICNLTKLEISKILMDRIDNDEKTFKNQYNLKNINIHMWT